MNRPLDIVILGLSITSSWGNGHATTYRGIVSKLVARGHRVLFLERDVPWYAENRDNGVYGYGSEIRIYNSVDELDESYRDRVRDADAVIVGSYVPDGIAVGEWVSEVAEGVTAFYDIDTPVTLQALRDETCEYLSPRLVRSYDLYLSFSGGPILQEIEQRFGARQARSLYCSVDPSSYYPETQRLRWDLGYLGTYSTDRQPALDRLLISPAMGWPEGRFAVAGSMYPEGIRWPANVERIHHIPPAGHRGFYNSQKFTLNITRAEMVRVGYSPSVRLFEAAACGTPIISDWWEGLAGFFEPGLEIVIAQDTDDCLRALRDMSDTERKSIGERARRKTLTSHTSARRAEELESLLIASAGIEPGVEVTLSKFD